jgi:hypothetical protein
MIKPTPFFKKLLLAWGTICLAGTIGFSGFIAYQLGPGNKNSAEVASKQDVRYVLNWCNLGDERIDEVVHSYISSRSFTGDHLDAHAIRIAKIDISELNANEDGRGWFRGDQLPVVVDKGIEFVQMWLPSHEVPWFLDEKEIRSTEVFVYPWSIYFHGTRPTAAEIIFIRPKDKMVFFFGAKT